MIFNLLDSSSSAAAPSNNGWTTWLMMGVLIVIIVVFMIYNRRSQKKRQEETMNMLNAIKPGNKVKTIGGVCGIVVEVCDDNTFVLETGTEQSGKSYLKFDKQAVYQTDAVAEKPAEKPVAKADKADVKTEEVSEVKADEKEESETTEKTE